MRLLTARNTYMLLECFTNVAGSITISVQHLRKIVRKIKPMNMS